MLIRLAYDIQFDIPASVAMVALLNVHPSRAPDLLEPDEMQTEPKLEVTLTSTASETAARGLSLLQGNSGSSIPP